MRTNAGQPRPPLREIPLQSVVHGPGTCAITINPGAWNALIAAAWNHGWYLLEVENEVPVRAFQRETARS